MRQQYGATYLSGVTESGWPFPFLGNVRIGRAVAPGRPGGEVSDQANLPLRKVDRENVAPHEIKSKETVRGGAGR